MGKPLQPTGKKVKPALKNVEAFRKSIGESQGVFWKRFMTTQSAGCRYELAFKETGRRVLSNPIPGAVGMLVLGFMRGDLDEELLAQLRKAAKASGIGTSARRRVAAK